MTDSVRPVDIYLESALDVPRTHADAVCNFIIANICSGLLLEDEEDRDQITIKFYVPIGTNLDFAADLTRYLSTLQEPILSPLPEIVTRRIANADWEQQYRLSVMPIEISDQVVVRPPWHRRNDQAAYDIIIEPKMAFGTGRHETTRSCLRVISQRLKRGARFLDLGCGSGILGILAAKMQAAFIKAVDNDPLAVDNCRENFKINRLVVALEIRLGSLEQCDGDPAYDFVAVNIIKETILPILPRLRELTKPDGLLLLAGLLERDEGEIRAALDQSGLRAGEITRDGEWLTLIAERS